MGHVLGQNLTFDLNNAVAICPAAGGGLKKTECAAVRHFCGFGGNALDWPFEGVLSLPGFAMRWARGEWLCS